MRIKCRKILTMLLLTFVFSSILTGCSFVKITEEQKTPILLENEAAKGNSVEQAPLTKESVAYGDTIRASYRMCEKYEGTEHWQDMGEITFVADTTSWEFQMSDYLYEDEKAVQANVDYVIGQKVGDTFTLKFENGGGSTTYEYTILEIKETSKEDMNKRNVVEYGDMLVLLVPLGDPVSGEWNAENCEEMLVSAETSASGHSIWNHYSGVSADEEENIHKVLGKKENDTLALQFNHGDAPYEMECKISKVLKVGKSEEIVNNTAEQTTTSEEATEQTMEFVQYGDSLLFECDICTNYIAWEDAGEVVFTADKNGDFFYRAYESDMISETDVSERIERILGKSVGDTFIMWFTDDTDMQEYGYKYIILEVNGNPSGSIAFGDTVKVSSALAVVDSTTYEGHEADSLELRAVDGKLTLLDKQLSEQDSKMLIRHFLNKRIGEEIVFFYDDDNGKYQYSITVTSILPGEADAQELADELDFILNH